MDKMNQEDFSENEIFRVLNHPNYRSLCSNLFDVFCFSREIGNDANKVLATQAGLAEILLSFQEKKKEFENDNNKDGCAVMKRLILISKQIGDSIAWRYLNNDRVLIQLLSEHPATGYVDETVKGDFAIAQELIKQNGDIVLVNDITNVLRFGDLTIIKPTSFEVLETKYGKASSKNKRSRRQKNNLEQLRSFINTGYRDKEGRKEYILSFNGPISTYHSILAEGIKQARQKGYFQVTINECFALEVFDVYHENKELPSIELPFNKFKYWSHFSSIQIFDKPSTRIAPFGIFPLNHQDCFDLMTGSIVFRTSLNFEGLQQRYKKFGINLELPTPSPEEMEKYMLSGPGDRKKLFHLAMFRISENEIHLSKSVDTFGLMFLNFFEEQILIQTDLQLLNLVRDLKIPTEKIARFYFRYPNESSIWK
jgi:hypothetical protein